MRDLYTRSPDIPGPLRSSHYKISSKDLGQDPTRRKYREGCADELSARSLHKTSMRDLYTGALYKISSQDLYEISLYKISGYPWTS